MARNAKNHRDTAVERLLLALKTDSDAARADLIAEALDEHAEHVLAVLKNEFALRESQR